MGFFEKLFRPKTDPAVLNYFQMLGSYTPVWRNSAGGVYEALETRAAINTIATHCSKLKPHVIGSAGKRYERMLQTKPNPWQTTSQFLYRLATIFEVENNAFIIPMHSEYSATDIVGLFPVVPASCELREGKSGKLILRFTFPNGKVAYEDFDQVGLMTRMQFESDLFGDDNSPLDPTMKVIGMQQQAMVESIKQSASPRFLAKISNSLRREDLAAERQRFIEDNLGVKNSGGVMLFDQKYSDVREISSKASTIDAEQMKLIDDNVAKYFGVSPEVMRNEMNEEVWNAFYEGKIEPFALQASLVICSMLFSDRQIAAGNGIEFSANRLQFATTRNKLNTITQMFDRGMLSRNEGREILQMPGIGPEGDRFFIRGEYIDSDLKLSDSTVDDDPEKDLKGKEKEDKDE